MPAEVRKKLGVGPGSVLEWDEQNDEVVVRRAGRIYRPTIFTVRSFRKR